MTRAELNKENTAAIALQVYTNLNYLRSLRSSRYKHSMVLVQFNALLLFISIRTYHMCTPQLQKKLRL